MIDAATGETNEDWTSFDVHKSRRLLKTGDAAQQRQELRKLHLRWWHATRKQMETELKVAGAGQDILGMIPSIVETCRECRAWQDRGPDITPSVELVTKQNEQVEVDSMFYKKHMVWHMLDRADR